MMTACSTRLLTISSSPPDNVRCNPRPRSPCALLAFLTLGISAASCAAASHHSRDKVAKLLNEWFINGTAAGLKAITYENRDGQHSPLNTALYPQLQVFTRFRE
jgi:hypothetical protein